MTIINLLIIVYTIVILKLVKDWIIDCGDCSPPSHFVSGEASVLNEKFGILVSLAATRLSSSFMLPQQAVTT
jgi:hypothetical protein